MAEIQDLQAIVNKRAEQKLDADIRAIVDVIRGDAKGFRIKLVDHIDLQLTVDGKTDSFRSHFWSTSSPVFEQLKKKLLPQYIQSESLAFLAEIEGLKDKVAELTNQIENIQQ